MPSLKSLLAGVATLFRLRTSAGRAAQRPFDEAEYLRLNPDVAAAVARGEARSGRQHWSTHGQREGRHDVIPSLDGLPRDFHPDVYRRCNPDIEPLLAKASLTPGQHWLVHGRREGRCNWSMVEHWRLPPSFDEEAVRCTHAEVETAVASRRYESAASWWLHEMPSSTPQPIVENPTLPVAEALRFGFDPARYALQRPHVWRTIGNDPQRLAAFWTTTGFLTDSDSFGLQPYGARRRVATDPTRDAVALYGFFDEPSGLGTAARALRSALRAAGFDVVPITIRPGPRFTTEPDARQLHPRCRISLFAFNADMVHRFFLDDRRHLLDDTYAIGLWFWELARFPVDQTSAAGAFDEIWVASEFCRAAIAPAVDRPVVTVPPLVEIDETTTHSREAARARFELPSNVFVFATIFDIGSTLDRKNPLAVVQAFKAAFGAARDVVLLLKFHGAHHYPDAAAGLMQAVHGASNIRCIDAALDAPEIAALRSAIDCLVSAHRSEGFGLNLAEAMRCGIPVVATNYGGCTDFLDASAGFPIDYTLTTIERDIGPYARGERWAEPNVDHLATILRHVRGNEDDARARGAAGRARIVQQYGPEAVIAALRERLGHPERAVRGGSSGAEDAHRGLSLTGPRDSDDRRSEGGR